MYSLSLIFWELLRRTKYNNELIILDYKMPYYEYLPIQDPDLEQMYKIVCIDKMRPELQNKWKLNPILNEFTQIIEELWNENSYARLNALRLKKSLNSLYRKFMNNENNN
jgi:TGF-beta receptor type-1